MNAYELADALAVESSQMEYGYVVSDWELLDNSANMLRQQADRIGVLEANHKIQKNINDKALQYIAELEKDLHMTERHYERLHTQTKPLSDDEIEQLREYHGINDWLYETSVTDFARAIEQRHGIK